MYAKVFYKGLINRKEMTVVLMAWIWMYVVSVIVSNQKHE